MKTFSSIYPFTNRLELRRATCITSGAEGGGGGAGKMQRIKELALEILRELPDGDIIRTTDWANKVIESGNRGEFARGTVWPVISRIIAEPERHGIEHVSAPGRRGYRMAKASDTGEPEVITSEKIREVAQQILDEQSGGQSIKLADWIAEVMRRIDVPETVLSRNRTNVTIHNGFIGNGKVERVGRGMYRVQTTPDTPLDESAAHDEGADDGDSAAIDAGGWKEKEYYKPFAAYLRDILLECDGAKNVSGIRFGTESENPDVIGLAVGDDGDSVRYTELVSAEVKSAPNVTALMKGFEQSCAYTRFSHKVYYLVVPISTILWSNHEPRLTDLCHELGIGLVVADPDKHPDKLPFTLLTRARRRDPVMSELNRYLWTLRENGGDVKAGRLAEFGFRVDEEADEEEE